MRDFQMVISRSEPSVDLAMSTKPSIGLQIERKTPVQVVDYEVLANKPSIEGHTLIGDSTLPQIGVGDITPQDIDRIIFG